MVDLDAMDRDPWPTWPVDKQELRILVEENEKLRTANVYLCSRVDYLPYCHEIERLRAALQRIVDYGLVSSADLDRACAALEGEKADG
jgi:hypothetical protein